MSTRRNTPYPALSLGATSDLLLVPGAPLYSSGHCSVHCVIDNGSGGAPTDSPVGVFELWASANGETFYQVTNSAIVTALAAIAPNGNNVVSDWVVLDAFPGTSMKLLYRRTSGGGTNATAHIQVVT